MGRASPAACVPLLSINRSKSRLCARSSLSGSLGSRRPDLVVRFGHSPQLPYSLRRRVAEVIVRLDARNGSATSATDAAP
jgi:hypothetical protein